MMIQQFNLLLFVIQYLSFNCNTLDILEMFMHLFQSKLLLIFLELYIHYLGPPRPTGISGSHVASARLSPASSFRYIGFSFFLHYIPVIVVMTAKTNNFSSQNVNMLV